jgi:lysophospholipase L1-like esterase
VTHNSRGNRTPEVTTAKPAEVRRVVLLGDSNTWGYGLADDETVGARLTDVLAGGPGRWEVINLGVTGYGTDQEYLKLLVQGVDYAPDWVVVVYFHLNDVPDSLATLAYGVEKPRFWLRDGRLCLGNVPPPVSVGWPNHQVSRIVEQYRPAAGWRLFGVDLAYTQVGRFVGGRQWRPWVMDAYGKGSAATFPWLALDRRRAGVLQEHLSCPGPEVPVADGLSLVVALLRRMQDVTAEVGGRFLIVATPTAGDYKAGHPHEQYTRALHMFSTADLPALDMFAIAQAKNVSPADLYQRHADDDHFSVLGQRLMADAIASVVLGE